MRRSVTGRARSARGGACGFPSAPAVLAACLLCLAALAPATRGQDAAGGARRPNILFAIADDQSWVHTGAAGYPAVRTPAFDRVAREGVRFPQAFSASPGCSPSRAALLTGRHPWQLEEAGTHASSFPRRWPVYPDLLREAGYHVGQTGKGWGPGNWQVSGWPHNPAGPAFNAARVRGDLPASGIGRNDYAANFRAFLAARPAGKPFCFWYGASEPHLPYEAGSGQRAGKRPADARVPPFLPDTPEVRGDLLDYCLEIEWFDRHLGEMLRALEERGELENTLVVVTSDNGMPFPRAKANLYDYGFRVPLAVRWPARVPGGRVVDDLVPLIDLAPTFLEAAGLRPPATVAGRSLMAVLASRRQGTVDPERDRVFAARERHSSSRHDNLGYPSRALRTRDYLYIRNFHPERWPAGDPRLLREDGRTGPVGAFHDIDACPTKSLLIARRADPQVRPYFEQAVGKRPAEELYDVRKDPGCLRNLAGDPAHAMAKDRLRADLERTLRETGDPRVGANPEVWETYPRYSPIRRFPPPGQAPDTLE